MRADRRYCMGLSEYELDALWLRGVWMKPGARKWAKNMFNRRVRRVPVEAELDEPESE